MKGKQIQSFSDLLNEVKSLALNQHSMIASLSEHKNLMKHFSGLIEINTFPVISEALTFRIFQRSMPLAPH